jgi:hypothetical protein
MRTRFSPILICGAATLFAACESSSTTRAGGGDASSSDASSGDTVDGSGDGSDGSLDDVSGSEDVDDDDDVYAAEDIETPGDVPVVAEDVPGRTDIEFPTDVDQDATTDVESPDVDPGDVDVPDVDVELDVDPGDVDPGDVDPGDVDPGDVDPGDVDPGDVDDVQTPKGPQIGEPCDGSIQSWCSDEAVPTLSCEYIEATWVWTEYNDNGLPCFCDPMSSPGPAICAVPGFVGIDMSGRERRAPSLRSLRRAARLA